VALHTHSYVCSQNQKNMEQKFGFAKFKLLFQFLIKFSLSFYSHDIKDKKSSLDRDDKLG
jgi:hypothetical protein